MLSENERKKETGVHGKENEMEQTMNRIKNLVEKKVEAGCTVSAREEIKNNGALWHGIMIAGSGNHTVCPVIYVDGYLAEIREGRMTELEVADAVIESYRSCTMQELPENMSFHIDKRYVLDRVVYALVNTEMNYAELQKAPHRDFLDMSAEYRILLEGFGDSQASAKVSRKICEDFGITESELDAAAMDNTRRGGFVARHMSEILAELTGLPMESENELPMMVYTSKARMFGATVMLYPDEFMAFAEEVGDDLFILPSSIHEVIAVPTSTMSKYGLMDMVNAVNKTEVAAEEVLGKNVYRYNLSTGEITLA